MNTPSKHLLVLDLDETLVHAANKPLEDIKPDFTLDDYYVYKRPHLDTFLRETGRYFHLAIWSSADDAYISEIVDHITSAGVGFEVVWGRSRCSMRHDPDFDVYHYEKRLDKLKRKGFPLSRILMVDDTPKKAAANFGNAIYISEFRGDQSDKELLYLGEYLLSLKDVENVRTLEKRHWRSVFEK